MRIKCVAAASENKRCILAYIMLSYQCVCVSVCGIKACLHFLLLSVFSYGQGKLAQNVFNQFQLNDDPHNQRKMRASRSRARNKEQNQLWHCIFYLAFVSEKYSCAAAFEPIEMKIYHIFLQ